MFKNHYLFLSLLISPFFLSAQEIVNISETFNYNEKNELIENNFLDLENFGLQSYSLVKLLETKNPKAKIISFEVNYENTTLDNIENSLLPTNTKPSVNAFQSRKESVLNLSLFPFINDNGNTKRIKSFDITIEINKGIANVVNKNTFTSVLSSGEVYKIAVNSRGVYKLDYNYLKTTLGIDVDNINPKNIHIYGNGGGRLPQENSAFRYDDLEENAILVVGEEDGTFGASDYILFYGDNPHQWFYDIEDDQFEMENNIYSDNSYYYLKVDSNIGLRIQERMSVDNTETAITTFQDYARRETERYNPLHEFDHSTGTGQDFVGELFHISRDLDLPNAFTFDNIVASDFNNVKARFYARSETTTQFKLNLNNQLFTKTLPRIYIQANQGNYKLYSNGTFSQPFDSTNDNLNIDIHLNETGNIESKGWLDYIEVNAMRELKKSSNQLFFRNHIQDLKENSKFTISDIGNNDIIWDITDPTKPVIQQYNNSSFGTANNFTTQEFVTFSTGLNPPTYVGLVPNQNLHSINDVDMVIIYPTLLKSEAERLKNHRIANDQLDIAFVDINEIWNEFGSGSKDVTAIRDFARMVYLRNPDKFKYVLLFGDASFDFKNIYEFTNQNLIPTYETASSDSETASYPTDDYYTLMDEDEGELSKGLDLAIGRIPVNNLNQAKAVVDKIIRYETDPIMYGPWKNETTHLADDEDGNTHVNDQDDVTNGFWAENPVVNVNKVYFDAFEQISTSGGDFFPKVTETINNSIFQGRLIVNYMGHGGPGGWAQERVLKTNHINTWTNINKLPLIVTATCSFTGYDDPTNTSAGEMTILNPNGGAIGLFSTVRAVFTNSNRKLNTAVMGNIFDRDENYNTERLGEILRISKIGISGSGHENNDKFQCIGDPSMKLNLPEHKIRLTYINIDTMSALDEVVLRGEIITQDSILLSNFNGKAFTKILDKVVIDATLGQDGGSSIKPFTQQNSILYKGVSTVTDGKFEVKFVVPKDINYDFGYGKISFYAHNNVDQQAAGYINDIVIGGTSSNPVQDDTPPIVDVYMNDENFVSGGLTDSNPILKAIISDDYGINLASSSIGHELSGLLDNDFGQNYILNNFYASDLDDSKKGTVSFPLEGISEGLHTIRVRAWDIANNFGDGETEFLVVNSTESLVSHVLNYPNPFFSNTSFQFEHNFARADLDVDISIFSISGKLIKTIQKSIVTEGNRVKDINWDGTDEYGDRLATGIYLYKVKIRPNDQVNLISESDFQKLVILNK